MRGDAFMATGPAVPVLGGAGWPDGRGCGFKFGVTSATTILSRLPVDDAGAASETSGDALGSTSLGENGLLSPSRMRSSEAMWSTHRDGMRSTVSRYRMPVVTSIEHAIARFMPPSDPQTTSA